VTVISVLERSFEEHFSQLELAHRVNLSPSRLCHLFKIETGMAPLQYQKALKMEKARHLLETTFLSVKQIMKTVGIRDESHFVRDFKRHYGLSPLAYRAKNQHDSKSAYK
jgi:transcriptional regulator GlxA family with amidase domain